MLDQGLNANGIQSSIATGFVQGAEAEDPSVSQVELHRIKHLGRAINPIADHKAMKEFLALAEELKPDIIHTHTFKAGLIARFKKKSLINLTGKEIKFIHTFHGHLLDDPEFSGLKKNAIIFIERALAKRTDKLVTVGQRVSDELLNNEIGNPNQYENIPPGVNELKLVDKKAAREILGISDSGKVVGWLARVTGVKNPLLAAEVANEFPELQFIFGGSGDQLDALKSSVKENSKVFGWVDAATFISACDVILSTSENEGMPIALIEAQMAGKPVVATDVGSVGEVVRNGATGFVTEKYKYQLVTKLQEILTDSELAKSMGKAAEIHANQAFSPSAMVQKHIDLYKVLT
jgi:glycosyltransferase involved in cell wall biosynthesis